jgi:hypothetical protein
LIAKGEIRKTLNRVGEFNIIKLKIMADRALVSMAEQFSGLPMRDLIGGPLMAAAEANNAMAVTQTKFLLDTCFQQIGSKEEEKYDPITITLKLEKGVLIPITDKDGNTTQQVKKVSTEFSLPLLTILPLNSLAVDDVNVAFHMEVKSSFGETTSKEEKENNSKSGSFSAKVGFSVFSAEVNGSISSKSSSTSKDDTHYEKSNSAKYDVSVHAKQIPLPTGITTIIQAYANAIDASSTPTEAPASNVPSSGGSQGGGE